MTEEQPEGGGRAAGGCLLLAAATGTGLAVYSVSRDLFVIVVWVIGTVLLWRAVRKKMPGTPDPAPPPASEGVAEEEPQVSIVRDKTHPNRWAVLKSSRWMREEIDKERDS